jgi:methionine-rich copper-binding protein CopC
MRVRGRLVGLLVLLAVPALAVLAPSPAQAHAGLQSADPGPGQHVDRLPAQMQLHFGRPTIPDPRTRVVVLGPGGDDVALGQPAASGLGISQRLAPTTVRGLYRVTYAVVSVDGHVTRGRYRFWVTATTRPAGGASPALGWPGLLVLGTVVSGGVLGGAVRRYRRRVRTAGDGPPGKAEAPVDPTRASVG